MNAERLRLQIDYFERAVARLADALAQPKDEYLRDSAIQRFEFTFELAWKVLKRYLAAQGVEARSPRAAIRGAFEVGLLPDDPGWLAMLDLCSLTTHTYDERIAEQIYAELPDVLMRFQGLLVALRRL
ncbi:MAG: nucleotidyltransferase substrate binding protein [Salinisphaera sp.]|nr:nucleotidyltransferase substrate binding protein [Salinisphaera sp.]